MPDKLAPFQSPNLGRPESRNSRATSRLGKLVLMFCGAVIPLLLLETVARVISPLALPKLALFQAEPGLGYALAPDRFSTGPCGERIQIDQYGFRVNETLDAPSGVNVLALGDSFMFGLGVEADQTFPAALEALLSDHRPTRVTNAGVPGYNLVQSVNHLERLLAINTPDVVVLGFLENDIHNVDGPDYEVTAHGTLRHRPGTYHPPMTVNPFQALSGPWLWLQINSAAFRVASYAAIRQRLDLSGDADLAVLARDAERSAALADRLLRGEDDPETAARFGAADQLLNRAVQMTRLAGVPLVLVVFPRPEQLESADLRGGNRRIADLARRAGLVVIDPAEALASEPSRTGLYLFPHDHHPSPRGYAAMAEEVIRLWPHEAIAAEHAPQ